MKKYLLVLLLIGNWVFAQKPKIIQRPITCDSTRRQLSLDYLKERHGLIQKEPTITPKVVVIHWTVIPTADATFRAFDSPFLPNARKELQNASQLNVSSQYLIDRDGTIFQLLPDTILARHCIGLNHCAIGIENVGDGDKNKLTEAQFESNAILVKYLKKKYKIKLLIGHHEYQNFRNTDLWKETDASYLTKKTDVGDEFMNRLRKKTKIKGTY